MAVKLIKACRNLNVGLSAIIDFCREQGCEIALDPNAIIDDETYLVLAKEFSKPQNHSISNTLILEAHKQNSNDKEMFSPLELSKQYCKKVEVIEEISDEDDLIFLGIELDFDCTFEEYTYHELLSRQEWRTLRSKILKRDKFKCTKCGKDNSLHVHHLYYIDKHLPWEYRPVALVTLCSECHKALHAETRVPVYDCDPEEGKAVSVLRYDTCHRCGGKGYIQKYAHVQDGICFSCWGSGSKDFYMQFFTQADIVDFIEKKKKLKYFNEPTDLPF